MALKLDIFHVVGLDSFYFCTRLRNQTWQLPIMNLRKIIIIMLNTHQLDTENAADDHRT